MYHTKRIALFISHIMGYYQKNVCQGIVDKALEYGYLADLFVSLDGENLGSYGTGESSILRLPNFDTYEGVIFASETYVQPELKLELLSTLKESCHCPVIEIAVANQNFPAVALENNHNTGELTTHLIEKHGYRRICYLGCSEEAYFSDSRASYYKEALLSAGFEIAEENLCSCKYSIEDVAAALTQFSSGSDAPYAVVCYNDRMALLLAEAALQAGLRIPEDIAITGCDDTCEGTFLSPALTTVSFPVYRLGETAVECLLAKLHGKTLPPVTWVTAETLYRGSCGCSTEQTQDSFSYSNSLNERIDSLEASILSSMHMSAAMQQIHGLDEGMDLLEHFVRTIPGCNAFYLCLYSDWDAVENHILELTKTASSAHTVDDVLLKFAIRNGKRLPECSFPRTSLLPEHISVKSSCTYIYTPLFFGQKSFGYIAQSYENNQIQYNFELVHWFLNISQMLRSICDAKSTTLLVRHLEEIYTKDALTGLYNKHGYLEHAKALLHSTAPNETLACFLFDLDGLKHINDTYGHNEGDFAIQVIGQALTSVLSPQDVCARFSGDEFYLLRSDSNKNDADELLTRIEKYLYNYNRLSSRDYTICVSGGYTLTPAQNIHAIEDLDAVFKEADEQMYLQKKVHHNA